MRPLSHVTICLVAATSFALGLPQSAQAQEPNINGQVLGAGAPVANSTVTLWATTASAPAQLAQTQTDADGRFALHAGGVPGGDAVLYLAAAGGQASANKGSGDNPAIALISVLGSKPPANVIINEMTTVASVWTHAQFLDGAAIKGQR